MGRSMSARRGGKYLKHAAQKYKTNAPFFQVLGLLELRTSLSIVTSTPSGAAALGRTPRLHNAHCTPICSKFCRVLCTAASPARGEHRLHSRWQAGRPT